MRFGFKVGALIVFRSGLELVGQYVMLMQVLTKVEVQGGVCVCVFRGSVVEYESTT